MTSFRKRVRPLVGLAVFGLAVSACADDKPLNTFEPRGPGAQQELDLMWPIVWGIMGLVFLIVVVGGIGLAIKNRVKEEDFDPDDLPEQVHGWFAGEITWTILPAIILAVVGVYSIATILDLETKNESSELDVLVIGRQWWWEYRYDVDGDGFFVDADGDGQIWGVDGEGADGPGGVSGDEDDLEWPLEYILDPDDVSTAGELVIPTGNQVDLYITSGDVIHSFWIPRLNGKRDAVPGRFTTWSVEADAAGKYTGWCTEFCGLSHARMRMSVIALDPADYTTWFENQTRPAAVPAEGTPEFAGRETFKNLCMSCHVIKDGELEYNPTESGDPWATTIPLASKGAPSLTHFASRTSFAGAIYGQYRDIDPNDDALDVSTYLNLASEYRWNEAELRRWIKNAPSRKDANYENQQGMLPFPQLGEEELDNLVASLATLD
ncbi:MAG: cytochrome c oxidase subunit II [Acidimicrobiales bacterium]